MSENTRKHSKEICWKRYQWNMWVSKNLTISFKLSKIQNMVKIYQAILKFDSVYILLTKKGFLVLWRHEENLVLTRFIQKAHLILVWQVFFFFFKSEVYLLIDSIIEVKRKQAIFSAYNAFLEKVKPTQMQREICAVYCDWSKVS